MRRGYLVELTNEDGVRGWGEALPLSSFGGESLASCEAALRLAADPLLGSSLEDEGVSSRVAAAVRGMPVALSACDAALLDLLGRATGRSVAQMLGGSEEVAALPLNALLSATSPAELEREAAAAVAAGFGTLKLKLGAQPVPADVECARAVRRAAPPPARIRFDANCAWDEISAIDALRALAELAPEWVEQPIAPGDPESFARVRAAGGVRLAADESAGSEQEIRALLERRAIDAVVLKLPTLGGPRRAHRLAGLAREAGVEVCLSSFLDSTLGIAAAAQVAACLPGPLPACGLATATLLADDLAEPWPIAHGALRIPPGAGLACELDAARIDRLVGEMLVDAAV